MKIEEMQVGQKYKPTEKQNIKVANDEIECRVPISSGTVLVPIVRNLKSVRVEFRFRDKDKNFTARLPFVDNAEINVKEI